MSSESRGRCPGAVALLAVCLTAAGRPATAGTRLFPLPMYTTAPNEGSTYGFIPVLMRSDGDVVTSITAPSVSWNSSAHLTGTFRFYRYLALLQSWQLILSASTVINRSLWLEYDDDRRTPRAVTKNLVVRVRRNLFYRYFGLGPDTPEDGESSYTRLYATANARIGWNLTSNFNLAVYGEVRGDRPERHAISGLPETQDLYPDAPGLGGSAFVRGGVSIRYDTRPESDYSRAGFATELTGNLAQGITGVTRFAQVRGTARGLLPELSFLQGAARAYWMQVFGTDVPFYDRASLGGEVLFRGFQEDRFIDMGAWEVEAEQRVTLFETHIFGVVTDWRFDPFVAAGQVYGEGSSPFSHVRVSGGAGLRAWIHPDILGRVDLAYGGEGLRAYVLLGYPY
ncbi:MAG TPA: BamA/TamA family outer membrane protein [Polyangia bacterium]|nr:BamA/TamA family outer membrane protein [Polyangia bacterium]